MSLTETTEVDKIEIVGEYKAVQIRTATVIKRDGVEISRSFHRHTLQPCTKTNDSWVPTNVTAESTEVQAVCAAVWTDAVRSAYQTITDV